MVIEIRKRTAEELEAVVIEYACQTVQLQTENAQLRKAVDYLCSRVANLDAAFDPAQIDCLREVC
jgi:hypothetical protein